MLFGKNSKWTTFFLRFKIVKVLNAQSLFGTLLKANNSIPKWFLKYYEVTANQPITNHRRYPPLPPSSCTIPSISLRLQKLYILAQFVLITIWNMLCLKEYPIIETKKSIDWSLLNRLWYVVVCLPTGGTSEFLIKFFSLWIVVV